MRYESMVVCISTLLRLSPSFSPLGGALSSTPSGLVNEVVLDMIRVKHWEYKS
jgi:hypothetical protein